MRLKKHESPRTGSQRNLKGASTPKRLRQYRKALKRLRQTLK